MFADVLFSSRARVRLLAFFLFSGGKRFHLREAAKLNGVAASHAAGELEKLVEAGVIRSSPKGGAGNLRFFWLNNECPFLSELKGLFLKTYFLGDELRKALEKFSVRFAVLFGSFAKGIETKSSDIDLLLVGKINEREFAEELISFEARLLREINYIVWSEEEFFEKAKEENHLLKEIVAGKFSAVIGDAGEFKRIVESGAAKKNRKKQGKSG
ncbi:MAG: nucleotidyltransferase domain-containing protein [Candidatus Diapherotrites archaeon]